MIGRGEEEKKWAGAFFRVLINFLVFWNIGKKLAYF